MPVTIKRKPLADPPSSTNWTDVTGLFTASVSGGNPRDLVITRTNGADAADLAELLAVIDG